MIILGKIANKRLINRFLDEWWKLNTRSFNKFHRWYEGYGVDMIEGLEEMEPWTYKAVELRVELLEQ